MAELKIFVRLSEDQFVALVRALDRAELSYLSIQEIVDAMIKDFCSKTPDQVKALAVEHLKEGE